MTEFSAYIGLDVHKDTIAVAVALPGREEPVYRGEIKNQRKSLLRLIRRFHFKRFVEQIGGNTAARTLISPDSLALAGIASTLGWD